MTADERLRTILVVGCCIIAIMVAAFGGVVAIITTIHHHDRPLAACDHGHVKTTMGLQDSNGDFVRSIVVCDNGNTVTINSQ